MGWYSRFVTNRPWLVIGIDLLLVLIMGPISIWYAGLPDFSDPNKGFEPRGTSIHGWNEATTRLTARLIKANGSLSYFPPVPEMTSSAGAPEQAGAVRRKRGAEECLAEPLEGVAQRTLAAAVIKASIEEPPTAIPRMVVETEEGDNLWKAEHMKSICDIEKEYIAKAWDGCPAFTLPYYIGALRNKDCDDINDNDMEAILELLLNCSQYYIDGSLTVECANENATSCDEIPNQCRTYNAPYYIFHYFTDVGFLKNADASNTFLKYSMIIYRKSWDYDEDSMLKHFLRDIEGYRINVASGGVVVKAMDYYLIFNALSRFYILSDLPFYGLAMILVVVVLLFYLRSPSLMLAVMLNVGLSLFAAYFFYTVVFQFKYFTFVNLLACLLLIAVGADDVFILHDIWEKHKLESQSELTIEKLNSYTLRHGVLSILVTSLTTAAALFANSVSDVTALKCFGIFGGVCILVNFFFMITLVPAILVLSERYSRKHPEKCTNERTKKIVAKMGEISQALWSRIMPVLLLKPWVLWLVVFTTVGVGGLTVVFYKPALRLPTSESIQVFYSAHPFEVYRNKMLDQFHFEIENEIKSQVNIELQFPFGIKGEDNGNILDPDDRGTLKYDRDFEIYSQNSQTWMRKFCGKLLEDKYTVAPERYRCFFDVVKEMVESRDCYYPQFNSTLPPQCCNNEFPLSKSDAKICYNDYIFISLVATSVNASNASLVGMPIYKSGSGELIAMTHYIETDFVWTARYPKIDKYYKHFEEFMTDMLESAPKACAGGWFAGAYGDEFFFYDLQKTMVQGTISGIALSMGVGFLVMLFTSGNIMITIYSILTISFVIAVTVGSLVLLGWELEVLEALVITLAVGLSIDFTIHLAVAYKVSPHHDRLSRSRDSIATVGSAVTMAGLTTFLSGAAITLGRVMSYYKFGVFLMLDMTISWGFSLFFFIPLCRIIGPQGNFGELKALADRCLACCGCACKTDLSSSGDNSGKIKAEEVDEAESKDTSHMNGHLPNSSGIETQESKPRDRSISAEKTQYVVDKTQDFSANKVFTVDDKGKEDAMYYTPSPVDNNTGPSLPLGVHTYEGTDASAFRKYNLFSDNVNFTWSPEEPDIRHSMSAPTSPVSYIVPNPGVYTTTQTVQRPVKLSKKDRKALYRKSQSSVDNGFVGYAPVQGRQAVPVYATGVYYTLPAHGWALSNGYKR